MNYNKKNRIIKINLNDHEYFMIHLQVDIQELGFVHRGKIVFHALHHPPYLLFDGTNDLWLAIGDLETFILDAIAGNRNVDTLGTRDFGYYFNQDIRMSYESKGPYVEWTDFQYHLWCSHGTPITWLYTHGEKIYFQVTPYYGQFNNYNRYSIPYKIFIRNYRPYVTRIISLQDAINLWEQISEIAILMLHNSNEHRRVSRQLPELFSLITDKVFDQACKRSRDPYHVKVSEFFVKSPALLAICPYYQPFQRVREARPYMWPSHGIRKKSWKTVTYDEKGRRYQYSPFKDRW